MIDLRQNLCSVMVKKNIFFFYIAEHTSRKSYKVAYFEGCTLVCLPSEEGISPRGMYRLGNLFQWSLSSGTCSQLRSSPYKLTRHITTMTKYEVAYYYSSSFYAIYIYITIQKVRWYWRGNAKTKKKKQKNLSAEFPEFFKGAILVRFINRLFISFVWTSRQFLAFHLENGNILLSESF